MNITLHECKESIGCEIKIWQPGTLGVICRGRILSVGKKYVTVVCYAQNLPQPVKMLPSNIVEFI